ncbi:MAG: serine/threonine-protein phosphatase [Butyrivibrio sp.]|nr:serine/threonine-protein phosphatase [Butyrivibrio sp.]
MEVKACIFTDAGKVRKINQDAAMIKVANTRRYGRISFACVCDGMGGLQKGEIASCKAIRALENWFMEELALMQNMDEEELWNTVERSLRRLLVKVNADIRRYGKHRGIKLGTTLTALLQIGNRYLTLNIGDSRIYLVNRKEALPITKDQSLIRQKLDEGLITLKEADTDPERNILLQSLGTGQEIEPEIGRGELWGDTTVVVCSDGFWRTLKEEDIHEKLCPQMCVTPDDMLEECKKLVRLALDRKEEDNISVAAMSLVG